MTNETKITPLPWKISHTTSSYYYVCGNERIGPCATPLALPTEIALTMVCRVDCQKEGEANAAYIVKCVNAHAGLVELIEKLTDEVEMYADQDAVASCEGAGIRGKDATLLVADLISQARAALAQAEGADQ
jgi:hypothetical protein